MKFEVVKIGWYEKYTEEIETLYGEFVVSIVPELKYNSDTWMCVECGPCSYLLLKSRSLMDPDLPATDIGWMSFYSQGEEIFNRCTIVVSSLSVIYTAR
jgi:hypothetical protein